MRGKAKQDKDQQTYMRITPAYAGKRRLPASAEERAGDHPRVCGEKTKKIP